ncbi:MAG: alpha/beta hydrolase [Cyanobacteria bacterium P01_F01_bin.42]
MNLNPSAWTLAFAQTNRIQLHYVTQGEGELVILLHGFPEFWYSWRFQIPVLAKRFKVVVPDLRGYNDSDKPRNGYDIDTLTEDILGLIKSLGYQKAHVVGHDCGGMIAWNIAHRFPEYLQSLSLLNAPHPYRLIRDISVSVEQMMRHWHMFAVHVPGLPEMLIQNNLAQFVKNCFQSQAVRKAAFSADVLQVYQAALAKKGAIAASLSHYRQLINPQSLISRLTAKSIDVPTLVLWGEDDSLVSPKLVRSLEGWVTEPLRVKAVPECGHWIQQEVPRLVNAELLNFLETV